MESKIFTLTSKIIYHYLKVIFEYFFPHQCLLCKNIVENSAGICPSCFKSINFINDPMCNICGTPFEYNYGENISCLSCLHSPPPYDICRALLAFDENSKALIHALKYNGQYIVAKTLTRMLFVNYKQIILAADFIIPVPIHRIKLILRGYNQAQVLGKYLSKFSNIQLKSDVLLKSRWTKSQTKLSKKARLKNVNNSFKIKESVKSFIENKSIILIDDVITTKATINACTKLLKTYGAKSVTVLSIATRLN